MVRKWFCRRERQLSATIARLTEENNDYAEEVYILRNELNNRQAQIDSLKRMMERPTMANLAEQAAADIENLYVRGWDTLAGRHSFVVRRLIRLIEKVLSGE